MLLKKTLFLLLFSLTNICSKTTLNNLSFSDLQKLQLNSSQIDDFLKHKKKYGKFISYLELQSIPSFNEDIIKKIRKNTDVKSMFFERDDSYKLKDKIFSLNISFSRNFNKNEDTEEDKDKTKDKILGSLNKVFVKLKIQHPCGVNLGIAGLKNRGEEFYLFNSNKKFPFIFDNKTHRWFFNTRSIFVEITDKWFFKKIIIGNFKVRSGQGLVFDNTFGFNKPLDPMKILKVQSGFKSCCNGEKCKLFGIANTIVIKHFSLSTFFSYNFLDANITKKNTVYSVSRQLIYNTKQNIEKKDKLREIVYGGFFTYNNSSDDFEVGINFVATHFSKSFNLFNGANLDYLFSSSKNYNVSVFSRWLIGAVHLFFEYAKSFNNKHFSLSFLKKNSGDALICGFMANILKNIDLSCFFRKYNPTYYNFYGKGFCVNTGSNCSQLHGCACNEIGLYNCLFINIVKNIDFIFSLDLFAVLNKAYNYDRMKGLDVKGNFRYSFYKNNFINVQCKYKCKKYKNHKFKKGKDNSLLIKIYFKKDIDLCTFNTYLYLPFNPSLSFRKNIPIFHFGIYECIDLSWKMLKFSVFVTFTNTKKDFPMWIKEKDNKIWTKIDSKYLKLGSRVCYNFFGYLEIDIFLSWTFKFEKAINYPQITVKITAFF